MGGWRSHDDERGAERRVRAGVWGCGRLGVGRARWSPAPHARRRELPHATSHTRRAGRAPRPAPPHHAPRAATTTARSRCALLLCSRSEPSRRKSPWHSTRRTPRVCNRAAPMSRAVGRAKGSRSWRAINRTCMQGASSPAARVVHGRLRYNRIRSVYPDLGDFTSHLPVVQCRGRHPSCRRRRALWQYHRRETRVSNPVLRTPSPTTPARSAPVSIVPPAHVEISRPW